MSKTLNKTVARFGFNGRRYEVDRLLDSYDTFNQGYVYDTFDVTDDAKGESIDQTGYPDEMGIDEIVADIKDSMTPTSKEENNDE